MSEQLAVQLSEQAVATASATLQAAEAFIVSDAETYQAAGEHMVTIKGRLDAVEAKRVETKADALSLCKKIDALFKPPLDFLTKARGIFAAKRQAWKDKETKRAEEAARILKEAAAREQARLDRLAQEKAERALAAAERETAKLREAEQQALAQAQDEEAKRIITEGVAAKIEEVKARQEDKAAEILATVPQVPVPVFAPPEMPKVGGVSDRVAWKHRVVNASLVPPEFTMPDDKKLGQYARAMKERAKVAGVEFYPEPVTAVKGASW